MTDEQPFSHITDWQVTQEWVRSPTTGHLEPGLVVTATMSWTDELGQTTTRELFGLLTPRDVFELRLN